MSPQQLRNEIIVRLDLGWSLERVDSALIEPAIGLSEEDRDALWLLAWSWPRRATSVPRNAPLAIAGRFQVPDRTA